MENRFVVAADPDVSAVRGDIPDLRLIQLVEAKVDRGRVDLGGEGVVGRLEDQAPAFDRPSQITIGQVHSDHP
jgi:hypothetical protein